MEYPSATNSSGLVLLSEPGGWIETRNEVVSDLAIPSARPPPVADALAVYRFLAAVSMPLRAPAARATDGVTLADLRAILENIFEFIRSWFWKEKAGNAPEIDAP